MPHSWTIVLTESSEWGSKCAGEGGRCRLLAVQSSKFCVRHLDDYRSTLLCGILRVSFQEKACRKTTENTVQHCGGGVGSVVVNHHSGGDSSMVVTTVQNTNILLLQTQN